MGCCHVMVVAVVATEATVPMRTTRSVEACAVVESAMSATIACEDDGMSIVVIPRGVVSVDGEHEGSMIPSQRTDEIISCCKERELPVVEDMAKVGVAIGQVIAIDVASGRDAHEIVEVDFVAVVVLLVVEVELIGHLVGEEARLLASFVVVHC